MQLELGGSSFEKSIKLNIYADEIWEIKHPSTLETWIYTGAIYERIDKPILKDLVDLRYNTNKENSQLYHDKNETNIHWAELKGDHNKKCIVERWLNNILSKDNFYFSLLGINTSNLHKDNFGDTQNLNSIYNRFFRSMLQYYIKSTFSNATVSHVFHEQGTQEKHLYFDWHTIKTLRESGIECEFDKIQFLPKSHRENRKSNMTQLCDVLLGIFKDYHCGIKESKNTVNRITLMNLGSVQTNFIYPLLNLTPFKKFPERKSISSSFFPKEKVHDIDRRDIKNLYYDSKTISTQCIFLNKNQDLLF